MMISLKRKRQKAPNSKHIKRSFLSTRLEITTIWPYEKNWLEQASITIKSLDQGMCRMTTCLVIKGLYLVFL